MQRSDRERHVLERDRRHTHRALLKDLQTSALYQQETCKQMVLPVNKQQLVRLSVRQMDLISFNLNLIFILIVILM